MAREMVGCRRQHTQEKGGKEAAGRGQRPRAARAREGRRRSRAAMATAVNRPGVPWVETVTEARRRDTLTVATATEARQQLQQRAVMATEAQPQWAATAREGCQQAC